MKAIMCRYGSRPTAVKRLVFLWLYGSNDEILYGVVLRFTLYMKRDLKICEYHHIDLKCLETLNNRLRNTNLDIQCFETPNSVLHNTSKRRETLDIRMHNTRVGLRCFETPNNRRRNTRDVASAAKHSILGCVAPA